MYNNIICAWGMVCDTLLCPGELLGYFIRMWYKL